MVINKVGDIYINKTVGEIFIVGDRVYANKKSDYEGLSGIIVEIRTDPDKETENETCNIYCRFDPPTDPEDIAKLEERFSNLYHTPKKVEDINLDFVIMAPEMLLNIE